MVKDYQNKKQNNNSISNFLDTFSKKYNISIPETKKIFMEALLD